MSIEARRPWERYLKRIKAFSSCSLGGLCSLGPSLPPVHRIERVTEDLEELLQQRSYYGAPTSVWAAIGEDHLAGLVALYGLALRRSLAADTSASEREAYSGLRGVLAAHLGRLHQDHEPEYCTRDVYNTVSQALVRTDTMRLYIALLAGVASDISTSPQPGSSLLGSKALRVLKEVVSLLEVLVLPDDYSRNSQEARRDRTPKSYDVVMMYAELQETHFIEHMARALLQASRCEGTRMEAAALLHRMTAVLASGFIRSIFDLTAGNNSLSYLVISHVVGLAAALDGGTTYGMPSGPGAAAAPLFSTAGRPLRLYSPDLVDARLTCLGLSNWMRATDGLPSVLQPHARGFNESIEEVASKPLVVLRHRMAEFQAVDESELEEVSLREYGITTQQLIIVEKLLSGMAVPPFKVAATWDVSMRLATCARDRLMALEAAQGQGLEQQQQRPRLDPHQAPALGLRALSCARHALWNVGWAHEANTPAPKRAQLERWWSLVSSFIPLAASPRIFSGPGSVCIQVFPHDFFDLLSLRRAPEDGPLPAVPSLDVVIALREGYPRLLELLLRRSSTPEGSCSIHNSNALAALSRGGWAQVLAFGAPGDVASLAATVAKAMRCAALRIESAVAAVRAAHAAAGVSDSSSEVTGEIKDVLDGSLSEDLVDAASEARAGLRRALGVAVYAARYVEAVLKPSQNDGTHFVHCLLECNGQTDVTAATAVDGATREGGGGAAATPAGVGSTALEAPGDGAEGAAEAAVGEGVERARVDQAGVRRRLARGFVQVAARVLPEALNLTRSMAGSCGPGQTEAERSCCQALAAAVTWVPLLAAAGCVRPGLPRAPPGEQQRGLVAAASVGDGGSPGRAQLSVTGRSDCLVELDSAEVASAAVGAVASEEASTAAAWHRFLWVDNRLPELLELALRMSATLCGRESSGEGAWVRVMWALVDLAPTQLAEVLNRCHDEAEMVAAAAAAAEAPDERPRHRPLHHALTMPRLRDVLGPEGKLPHPELLAALERVCSREPCVAAAPQAAQAGSSAVDVRPAEAPTEEELRGWVSAAALLPAPGEVLAVLPTCANPLCTNLEGDSEAALKLSGCGRCGGRVRYCCRECQVAHWKAGHKAECGKG